MRQFIRMIVLLDTFCLHIKCMALKNIAGALVKKSYLEKVTPVLLGGGMVDTVSFEDTWGETKKKFEAGTFDVGLLVAWSEACSFINQIDMITSD